MNSIDTFPLQGKLRNHRYIFWIYWRALVKYLVANFLLGIQCDSLFLFLIYVSMENK